MHFNSKHLWNKHSIPAPSFESDRLIVLDTLIVDDHSRLTLTRNLKKLLPIMPRDTIIVFQDRYNKDIIFAIQHENKIIDNLIIRRNHSLNKIDNDKILEDGQIDLHTSNEKRERTLHGENILLVDDESDLLEVYALFLNSEGYYNIQTFTDSRRVIKHLADLKNPRHYGLAIIDIRMPVINGVQLYNILKIFNPKIKVLFISALDAADELVSMYSIAHEDILRKPCERQDFIRAVDNAVLKIPEKW